MGLTFRHRHPHFINLCSREGADRDRPAPFYFKGINSLNNHNLVKPEAYPLLRRLFFPHLPCFDLGLLPQVEINHQPNSQDPKENCPTPNQARVGWVCVRGCWRWGRAFRVGWSFSCDRLAGCWRAGCSREAFPACRRDRIWG